MPDMYGEVLMVAAASSSEFMILLMFEVNRLCLYRRGIDVRIVNSYGKMRVLDSGRRNVALCPGSGKAAV